MKILTVLIPLFWMFNLMATEKLTCKGQEGESIAIFRSVSPGMPSEIVILEAKLKNTSAHLNTSTIVKRINNRRGFSYVDILGEKSFHMEINRRDETNILANAVMDEGRITEVRFDNLHCSNEGSALPPMPSCPNGDLNYALLQSAAWGSLEQGELLLDCGALVDATSANGLSSLQIVAGVEQQGPRSNLDIEAWLKLLIAHHADVNRINARSGMSILHALTLHGLISELDILLENGAAINTQDNTGTTPLMLAVSNDNEVQVRTFIPKKPNLSLKNKKGQTAHDIAVALKFENIADLVKIQTKVQKVKGLADGKCSPSMIHLFAGQEVMIEFSAPTENMFLFTASDFNLELMAMPGETVQKAITPKTKGNFKFECGIHGSDQQTHGIIMVM